MTEEEKNIKKQEALVNYNMAKAEIKNAKKKTLKVLIFILLILLVILIGIRLVIGRIYLSIYPLTFKQSVEHKLYINTEHYTVSFEDNKDFPIIPGLFYFRRSNSGSWYNMDKLNEDIIFEDDKIIIDILSDECYTHTDKVRVGCDLVLTDEATNKLIRKRVKSEISRLVIHKNGKNESVKYDGKFINDISKYVKDKGYYYIEVYVKYDGVSTKLVFFARRLNKL